MREIVFRVLAERPGHLEAQAVGAAFSAGVTLPIHITAPTLEQLQHEALEALIKHLGAPHCMVRVRVRRSSSHAVSTIRPRAAQQLSAAELGCLSPRPGP